MKYVVKRDPSPDLIILQLADMVEDDAVAPEGYELMTEAELATWMALPEQVAKKAAIVAAEAARGAQIQAERAAAEEAERQAAIDELVGAGIPRPAATILVDNFGGEN